MVRGLDLSADSFNSLLYASQLGALLLVLLFVAFPLDGFASLLIAPLLVLLVIATVIGLWREKTGSAGGTHLGTAGDITYDPIADPGQAARDRWVKAVRRLPGGDDDGD